MQWKYTFSIKTLDQIQQFIKVLKIKIIKIIYNNKTNVIILFYFNTTYVCLKTKFFAIYRKKNLFEIFI